MNLGHNLMKQIKPIEVINLQGVPCPQNSAIVLLKIAALSKNDIIEIILDDGEPIENLTLTIETEENCCILKQLKSKDNLWHLFVKVTQ